MVDACAYVLQVLEYLRAKVTDVVVAGARRDAAAAEMRAHVDQLVEMVSSLQSDVSVAFGRHSRLAVAGADDAEEFLWDARRLPTPRTIAEFAELSVKAVSSCHVHLHGQAHMFTQAYRSADSAMPCRVSLNSKSRQCRCACSMCMRTHVHGRMRLSLCGSLDCRPLLMR